MIERQIRIDVLLSSQYQGEERRQAIKCNYQIEHNEPLPYHVDSCQVKLEDNHEPTSGAEDKPALNCWDTSVGRTADLHVTGPSSIPTPDSS